MPYDTITKSQRRIELLVVCNSCPQQPYVQLTVPKTFERLESIAVETLSHDQGWADDSSAGSYTHFEIIVLDPQCHERLRIAIHKNRIANREPFFQATSWSGDDVQSIRALDTIQLLPVAIFDGWQNYVYSARISIAGTVLMSIDPSAPSTRQKVSKAQEQLGNLYRPLDAARNEIRLLVILPGQSDAAVQCTLKSAFLSDANHDQFEALSYRWGCSREMGRRIELSGHHLSVSSNVYNALLVLRQQERSRTIWVDALCINQSDVAERTSQVKLMTDIYATASRVNIWLNEQEKDTWIAPVDALFRLDSDIQNVDLEPGPADARSLTADELEQIERRENFRGKTEVIGANPCLSNSWFRRVWVLQEVFHARQVIVICGDRTCSWSRILHLNTLSHRHRVTVMGFAYMTLPSLFANLFVLTEPVNGRTLEFGYSRRKLSNDVLDIVVAGLDLDATDPRDKLFALLSLIQEGEVGDLQPDYSKEVALVYRDFTRWWIEKHKSLRILSAIHCSPGRAWQAYNASVPSTTSDLRPSWSFWYTGQSAFGLATLGLSSATTYRASGTSQVDTALLFSCAGSILRLRGVMLGTIETILPFPYFNAKDPSLQPFRKAYELLFDVNNRLGIYTTGSRAGVDYQIDDEEFARRTKNLFRTHERHAEQTGAIQCYGDAFFTTVENMRGLCPHQAVAGDTVVVLCGGNVPYLLRRSFDRDVDASMSVSTENPQRYTLVGECFVPHYMQGEAVQGREIDEIFDLV